MRLSLTGEIGHDGDDPRHEHERHQRHQTKSALPADGSAKQRAERYAKHQRQSGAGAGDRNSAPAKVGR